MEAYASCLCREIEAAGKLYPDHEVRTVFFGGGTPSILKKERICQIMEALRRAFSLAEDAEIKNRMIPLVQALFTRIFVKDFTVMLR